MSVFGTRRSSAAPVQFPSLTKVVVAEIDATIGEAPAASALARAKAGGDAIFVKVL